MQLNASLLKKALIFSAFFYVLIFSAGAQAQIHVGGCPPRHIDETARVSYVYDGDTLRLEDGRKIRLMGIDTPEVFSRHGRIDDRIKRSGEQAKTALKHWLNQSNQYIGLAFGPQRFDRYQRTLAHVYLPNGKNLQAALISQGHAIAFTTPPNDILSDCYRRIEAKAMDDKLGVWALPQYQLKRTSQLTQSSNGFHRLQAKVTRIRQTSHRVTLFLDERVEVKIRRYDLPNFNTHMLNTLENKNIEIRGWLHVKKSAPKNSIQKKSTQKKSTQNPQNKTHFIMTLRHPDAIKVLN